MGVVQGPSMLQGEKRVNDHFSLPISLVGNGRSDFAEHRSNIKLLSSIVRKGEECLSNFNFAINPRGMTF